MRTIRAGLAAAALGLGVAAARPAGADTWRPLEVWRIESGRVAPWAQPGTRIDAAYRGREVRFQTTGVVAPHPLACDGATYEWIVVGPEALFEGNLPAPAAQAAARARKRAFLSGRLRASITRYMAAPQPLDEAPAIDGDPFTDSQEYPDRFTLGAARTSPHGTIVPVHFADRHSKRRVDYQLVREGPRWLVDDLVDGRGESLRTLLGSASRVSSHGR